MESRDERVVQGDEGSSTRDAVQTTVDGIEATFVQAVVEDNAQESPVPQQSSGIERGTPVTIGQFTDHDPEQGAAIDHSIATGGPLFEDKDKPQITEAQYRKLRGQYFTVRHIPLTDCGHKMDVINQPRHANCENCWWQWFNFHPKLVETVDEAWREHGKAFVVRLRGRKFADMFARFIVTVVAFKKEEERLTHDSDSNRLRGTGVEAGEVRGANGTSYPTIEGGEAESGEVRRDSDEQGTREPDSTDGQASGQESPVASD
jgi:hypothetical protein